MPLDFIGVVHICFLLPSNYIIVTRNPLLAFFLGLTIFISLQAQ